jgi:Domain of unknown function (DUF4410)
MTMTTVGWRWRGWQHIAFLLTALVICTACGAGKTLVMKPLDTQAQISSIDVVEEKATVTVPDDVRQTLSAKLSQALYEEGTFAKGPEMTIRYRFIQYNPGSQFTRWFWGGIGNAGEGSLTVEATYVDASGNELATIQSEGKIGSGFFGGEFTLAVEKAANEIAEYTKQHFKRPS